MQRALHPTLSTTLTDALNLACNAFSSLGEYRDDRRHGSGVYTWASGDKYDGNWDNGKMSGHGTKTMANGDVYSGMWLSDKAHGWGQKRFAGGDSHEGEYRSDARHGYGKFSADVKLHLHCSNC